MPYNRTMLIEFSNNEKGIEIRVRPAWNGFYARFTLEEAIKFSEWVNVFRLTLLGADAAINSENEGQAVAAAPLKPGS